MDAVAITVGVSWTLAGLIFIGLALPLIRGQIPRNHVYGVHFSESNEVSACEKYSCDV